jgi:AcrR family transcriptional regulator
MTSATERIVDAADRLFRGGGLEAVTTRRIASELGVTAMALYKHFRDKDALVDALVARGFGLWEERLGAAIAAADPDRTLELALRAYRDFALAEPRYFELMMLAPRRGIPDARESLRETPSPAFGTLIARVQQQIAAGRFRVRDPSQLILQTWALGHGLIALHFTGRFSYDDDVFRRTYDGIVATALAQAAVS